MKGILGALAISAGWLAVTYRGVSLLRKRRAPEAWTLWFALVALSIAATLFHPAVYLAFDRAVGEPNLAQYVGHCFILIAAWQAHAMLLYLVYNRRGAGRKALINGVLVVAVLAAVGMLFALAPVDVESTQFTRDYAEAPYITVYWLTYLVGVNYLLVGLVRLVSRYAKLCNQDWLRLGLQLVAAGGVFGIAYWCHWMAYLVLRKTDLAIPTALNAIGYITAPAAVILVVVGSTLPAVGPRTHLPSPSAWRRDCLTYRKLYPLWWDLTSAVPEIVLHERRRGRIAEAIRVRHLSYRLYRRVVEILDSLLVLDQRLTSTEAVGHHETSAVAAAKRIRSALQRCGAGRQAEGPAVRSLGRASDRGGIYGEVAWLVQVAGAYATINQAPAVESTGDEPAVAIPHGIPASGEAEETALSTAPATETGGGRRTRLIARVITDVMSPAVLVAGISVIVAWHSGSTAWGIAAAIFAAGIPLSYIIRGVRHGTFDDHHINARERRPAVLIFAACSVVVGLAVMVYFGAPRQLVALVVAMLAGLALTLAVTHFWKVSFHSAVAAGTATILVLIFGAAWSLAWLIVAGIVWSRVYLRSHTPAQVVVGIALGALAAGAVYPLLA